MTRFILIAAPLMVSCSAFAQPPAPSLSPLKVEAGSEVDDVLDDIDEEVRDVLSSLDPSASSDEEEATGNTTSLDGTLSQGGLVFGKTTPGSKISLVTYGDNDVILDTRVVDVDTFGNFVFGFDRDHGPQAVLMVTYPGETQAEPRELPVEPVPWRESRITVAENKANPYKKEDLDKIAIDTDKKNAARRARSDEALWTVGFAWPADGCISSNFGSRRIVNGTPRRFHSGVDVAAPDGMSPTNYIGTEVRAPADGIVRLAESDMFFEGGLVFIDHGQKLESALMHLNSVDVAVGQRVSQGDPVGTVGMKGRVTGPHLHWSLKWQNRLVDPRLVVDPLPACTD